MLEANVLLEYGRTRAVIIPINLAIHFGLLPGENSETFCGHPKLSVKDIVHTKDGLPKVSYTNIKVTCVQHPTILYYSKMATILDRCLFFTGCASAECLQELQEAASPTKRGAV